MKKRRYKTWFTGAFVTAALLFGMAFSASAAEEAPVGPGWEREEKEPQAEDVILVEVTDPEESAAEVTYYKNGEAVFSVPGLIGRAGLASPEEKKEGDKKTPSGTYGFVMAFGIKEDPGCAMGYRQVKDGDVWVDDPESRFYNRFAENQEAGKDWTSAENLAAIFPWYDYCLALDYNEEQVPGKGSAIFLHCLTDGDQYTSGCISIPEENMETLLASIGEHAEIVIRQAE